MMKSWQKLDRKLSKSLGFLSLDVFFALFSIVHHKSGISNGFGATPKKSCFWRAFLPKVCLFLPPPKSEKWLFWHWWL